MIDINQESVNKLFFKVAWCASSRYDEAVGLRRWREFVTNRPKSTRSCCSRRCSNRSTKRLIETSTHRSTGPQLLHSVHTIMKLREIFLLAALVEGKTRCVIRIVFVRLFISSCSSVGRAYSLFWSLIPVSWQIYISCVPKKTVVPNFGDNFVKS